MTTGQRIRQLRKKRSWSQENLAASVGVGQKTVSFWEIGRQEPRFSTLRKLCKVFNLTLNEFAEGVDEE